MRRCVVLVLIFFSAAIIAVPAVEDKAKAAAADIEIVVVPIGDVDQELINEVIVLLEKELGIKYTLSDEVFDPGDFDRNHLSTYGIGSFFIKAMRFIPEFREILRISAYGQLDATRLLDELSKKYAGDIDDTTRGYIGITSLDIYTKRYNFLFGMTRRGCCAVMSYYRFQLEYDGKTPSRDLLRERMLKQAVSNTFYIFNMRRCRNKECMRSYSHTLKSLDQKAPGLCDQCKQRLERYKQQLPDR